jgi:hypothetical protein
MLTRISFLALTLTTHVLTSAHHLVNQQKLLGEYGRNIQELSLHDVTIPNSGDSCGKGLTSVNINTEGLLIFKVSFLNFQESVLSVETGVLSESARNHEEGISECDDSELYLTGNSLSGMFVEVL